MKALTLLSSLGLLLLCGCPSRPAATGRAGSSRPDAAQEYADEMINRGIDTLDCLEQFDADDVRGQIVGRIVEMGHTGQLPATGPADPLLATCPEPDMLRQTVNRLNQWAESQPPPAGGKRDALLRALPPELARLDVVRELDKMQFSVYDGLSLLEAVWLRDLSQWARGQEAEELQQARQLFDWLVRNIQLEAETAERVPQFPWETLLAGRGTATERAWVYLLLLRQQGLDAAILAVAPARASAAAVGVAPRTQIWCVGVLAQHNGARGLYLFEPSLGLPVPARNGVRLLTDRAAGEPGARAARATELDVRPATIAEVIADHSLLDRLDFAPQHPYWVKAADLDHIVVLVEASPLYVAARSRVVESLLAGRERLVLTTDPTAQAERIRASIPGGGASARLWYLPYATLQRRSQLRAQDAGQRLDAMLPLFAVPGTPLFKGRILHLKGRFQGQPGAIACYQAARPATRDLLEAEPKRAAGYYEHDLPAVRQLPPAERPTESSLMARAKEVAHWETTSCLRGKRDASYWLGLIAAEEGNFPAAIDYFAKRTPEATASGPWLPGIHYNLARAYEALGQPQRAVEEYLFGLPLDVLVAWQLGQRQQAVEKYLSGIRAPMHPGNLLRAGWLKELTASGPPK
jgi:tetratricopeptide (TPR) repeat protein